MTKFLHNFMRDESGAAAAEYALILAIVGGGIAGAALYLGQQINTSVRGAGSKIATCGYNASSGC